MPLVRALWRLSEQPVDHEGRFYRCKIRPLDPMTEPPVRDIPIFTAGVNPRMIESAGRVADGLIGHTLFSPQYIEEVALPSIERGARAAGRDPGAVAFAATVLCAISDDEELARRDAAAMIAFYGSVKTYGHIFSISGFEAEAERIRAAFARHDVAGMAAAVSDEMVDTFAVAGRPDDVKARLRSYDRIAQHVILFPPSFDVAPDRKAANLALLIEHGND